MSARIAFTMNMKRTSDFEKEINDEFEIFLEDSSNPVAVGIKKIGVEKISLEEKEFLLDKARTVDADVHKAASWIKDLSSSAQQLIVSKCTDPIRAGYFFVQLFEAVINGTPYFERQAKAIDKVKLFWDPPKGYKELTEEIASGLKNISGGFAKEEWEVLEYLRIYFSHFGISKYRGQYTSEKGSISLDLNNEPRRTVRLRIDGWIRRHDGNPIKMAEFFAQKFSADLTNLGKKILDWEKINIQ
jgi:sulfur relay (sulfurtransferase) DsrC/TusE family protein